MRQNSFNDSFLLDCRVGTICYINADFIYLFICPCLYKFVLLESLYMTNRGPHLIPLFSQIIDYFCFWATTKINVFFN